MKTGEKRWGKRNGWPPLWTYPHTLLAQQSIIRRIRDALVAVSLLTFFRIVRLYVCHKILWSRSANFLHSRPKQILSTACPSFTIGTSRAKLGEYVGEFVPRNENSAEVFLDDTYVYGFNGPPLLEEVSLIGQKTVGEYLLGKL